jgi:multisubunit Na+/H+ antiporter MnhB subunit
MSNLPLIQTLTWTLAAFFGLGFVINTFAVSRVGPDYRRWGYPNWFHFVTGGLELLVALLLPTRGTRLVGVALGCTIMFAAAGTLVRHREFKRAGPPLIVFLLLTIVGGTVLWDWATGSAGSGPAMKLAM